MLIDLWLIFLLNQALYEKRPCLFLKVEKYLVYFIAFQQAVPLTQYLKSCFDDETHSWDFGWLMLFIWVQFALIECRKVHCQCEEEQTKTVPSEYRSFLCGRMKDCNQILKQKSSL